MSDGQKRLAYWKGVHATLAAYHAAIGILVFAMYGDEIENTKITLYTRKPTITVEKGVYSAIADEKADLGWAVSPIAIHALVSCITAGSHVASAVVYKTHGLCPSRPNPVRWIEYGITATLMSLSGFIGIGQGDLFFLMTIALLGVILQYCGYKVEDTALSGRWRPYFLLGVIIETAIALPLMYGTLAASRETGGAGLVVLLVAYVLYYASFGVNSWVDAVYLAPKSLRYKGVAQREIQKRERRIERLSNQYDLQRSQRMRPSDPDIDVEDVPFMVTDERYAVLSVTSKTALFWITVGSILRETETDDSDKAFWLNILIVAAIVPAAVFIIFILYQKSPAKEAGLYNIVSMVTGCASVLRPSPTREFFDPATQDRVSKTQNLSRDLRTLRQLASDASAPPPGDKGGFSIGGLRF